MKNYILLLLLACLVALPSCGKKEKISVTGIEAFDISNLSRPEIVIRIDNRTRHNITVMDGKFTIFDRGTKLIDGVITDDIVIPKRTESRISIPVRMKVSNPLALLAMSLSGLKSTDNLSLKGQATVKAGPARRKVDIDIPLSDFFRKFDAIEIPAGLAYN